MQMLKHIPKAYMSRAGRQMKNGNFSFGEYLQKKTAFFFTSTILRVKRATNNASIIFGTACSESAPGSLRTL